MYQIFQEYFKDSKNIKYFLKYDGEREKNKYTIMLIDKNNADNTLVKNTDAPLETYMHFLNEKSICENNKLKDVLFDKFTTLRDMACSNLGMDVIFILTIEFIEEIEIYSSLLLGKKSINLKSSEMKQIDEFIEGTNHIN